MKSRISVTLLVLLTFGFPGNSQQRFYKIFEEPDYHYLMDMIAVDENRLAFITSKFFYHTDGNGKVLFQRELKHGSTSSTPQSLICDQEGSFWIALTVFDPAGSRKVLYKYSSGGQILKTVDLGVSYSLENMQMVSLSDNKFFLSYQDRDQSGNAAVRLLLLDKLGNKIWEKQATDTISRRYSIKKGPNNTADIYYQRLDNKQFMVATADVAGNIHGTNINLIVPANTLYNTNNFTRTDDGFIFCGVHHKNVPLLSDGLIYKADKTGNILWQKTVDIRLLDDFTNIEAVADGYILLSYSGADRVGSSTEGDVVLIKTDKQGNKIWTRAFGGPRSDYARHLRMLDQSIVFAGQSSYPNTTSTIPFLCKTDLKGELIPDRPFEPAAVATMKIIETPIQQYPMTMVKSAPGPNTSLLTGGNFLKREEDQLYPFVTRNDKNAKQVWYKQLSDYPARLTTFTQIKQNEYVAVTERKSLFGSLCDIHKLDETGKILWTTQVAANGIRDAVSTSDGGMLLTGTYDISYINYETLLIKLDASGNVQWNKTIGDLHLWETGRKIIETTEKDFLITGHATMEHSFISSAYLLKIDANGNKLWSKTYADGLGVDGGYDLIITPDQGYLIAGTANKQPFTEQDLLLIKTDKNGNQLWRKTHHIHLMDEGFQVMNSTGGGFLVAGTTAEPNAGPLEKYIYVMKTDAEGQNKGIRYFGKQGSQTMNPSIIVLSSSDTIITGTTQNGYGQESIFLTTLEDFTPGGEPQNPIAGLYPNPSNGISSFVFNTTETGDLRIQIYDPTGRLVRHINRTKTTASFKEDLDISALPTGTYFVSIWFNGKRNSIKWLIIR
jgi:hypothetical protein